MTIYSTSNMCVDLSKVQGISISDGLVWFKLVVMMSNGTRQVERFINAHEAYERYEDLYHEWMRYRKSKKPRGGWIPWAKTNNQIGMNRSVHMAWTAALCDFAGFLARIRKV